AQSGAFPLNSVVATTTAVNLRDQPDAGSATVIILPVNAQAIVIGGPFNDAWYWLDSNGVKGYVSGRYLVLVDDNYTPIPVQTPTGVTTPGAQPTSTSQPQASGTTLPAPPSPVATNIAPGSTTPQASATPGYTVPTTPGDYT